MEEFEVRPLKTSDEVEQELELLRDVFGRNERVDLMVRKLISHHPTMTLDDFFVTMHNGRAVAGLCLIPQVWSVGGIPIKTAELGCVASLPEYRNRGLQRRLMNEYHARVADQRYDLSAIEGIPYFYRQFGYEYALPLDEQTRIPPSKVPEYKESYQIRRFTNGDLQKGRKLLERSQQKFLVHSVRSDDVWRMQQKTSMAAEYSFEDYVLEADGEMTAYFRIAQRAESKELVLTEASDLDQLAARQILRFLKDTARKLGLETIAARTSYYDSFTERIVALGGAQAPAYAWQIRVTNCVELLRKLGPLLEQRLARSEYNDLTRELNFNFYRTSVQMILSDGLVEDVRQTEIEDRTMRFNPLVFVKLLLGYRSREELEYMYPDFIVRPEAKNLVDVLFPKRPSHIHIVY